MPLVAHNALPSFDSLRKEGSLVLPAGRAMTQDIREMHIGLLNMMPDKALQATERQFFRLIGASNQIAQFYVHPFTLPALERDAKTRTYIDQYYESFEDIKKEGLDALIITGAVPKTPELTKEAFWAPLQEVMDWAQDNVTSTICSCLATHAMMEFCYNQKRQCLKKKLWGVYPHKVLERTHPLVTNMNTIFQVPHSRNNDITRSQFEEAGMKILVEGKEAGVHIATSCDGFRVICFQGHPEYDTVSLLKEYKRDFGVYITRGVKKEPPFPAQYFGIEEKKILKDCKKSAKKAGSLENFPDKKIQALLENTWRDSARAVIGNWLGCVYQTTHVERNKLFMDGIDPDDPLGLKI